METKWLEDFVSLTETRSFSRSAQLRHVTQPAFSRRIQALEAWVGADLVDRTVFPTQLTPAGETFYDQALEMLSLMQTTRAMLRGQQTAGKDVIEFAVPHALAFTFFPHWISTLRADLGAIRSRLIAMNVHDGATRLVEGSCDLLIVYHHPSLPLGLDPEHYEVLDLGKERIGPYSLADGEGNAVHCLPGSRHAPLPYLAYSPGAYLSQLVEVILKRAPEQVYLDRIYETDMAEALKAMALEGSGLAFLPALSAQRELKAGKLAPAGHDMELTMDIRLYRARPEYASRPKKVANVLWDYLRARSGTDLGAGPP